MFQTQKQQFFSITFLYFLIANAILVLQKIWEKTTETSCLFTLFTNQPSCTTFFEVRLVPYMTPTFKW